MDEPDDNRRHRKIHDPRLWVTLGFIALAQLMVALDATIINIALPSAQSALGFSDANRQWVVTAYTLAFAGLVLLGGRIADDADHRRLPARLDRVRGCIRRGRRGERGSACSPPRGRCRDCSGRCSPRLRSRCLP